MLEAAEFVARLGILEADISSIVFKDMVERAIVRLAKNPKKAGYFPVKLPDGTYQAFFRDSVNSKVARGGKKINKRPYNDKNKMTDHDE